MGEREQQPEKMATTSTAVTVPPQLQEESSGRVAVLTLRQTRRAPRKKVVWTEDTIDNEHMNKKKSKCCCIYEKPRQFGESDSEDSDDECEHCAGHVERRHRHGHVHEHDARGADAGIATPASTATTLQEDTSAEQPVTVTLYSAPPNQLDTTDAGG